MNELREPGRDLHDGDCVKKEPILEDVRNVRVVLDALDATKGDLRRASMLCAIRCVVVCI